MTVSGGFMRKPSARVGTAAYWIEVFEEQAQREAAKRRAPAPAGPPEAPPPPQEREFAEPS